MTRVKDFYWKSPKLCNEKHPNSAKLPKTELDQPCRGCGLGQYRTEDLMDCEYCPTGFYQPRDNKEGKKEIIKECLKCGQGKYAKKVRDFSHFEIIG